MTDRDAAVALVHGFAIAVCGLCFLWAFAHVLFHARGRR